MNEVCSCELTIQHVFFATCTLIGVVAGGMIYIVHGTNVWTFFMYFFFSFKPQIHQASCFYIPLQTKAMSKLCYFIIITYDWVTFMFCACFIPKFGYIFHYYLYDDYILYFNSIEQFQLPKL